MTASTSRIAYTDCFELYDRALENEIGIRVRMPTAESCYTLRTRLHSARVIDRKDNVAIYREEPSAPLYGRSIYDQVICQIKQRGSEWYVYLSKRQMPGHIESLDDIKDDAEVFLPPAKPQPQLTSAKSLPQIEFIRRRI